VPLEPYLQSQVSTEKWEGICKGAIASCVLSKGLPHVPLLSAVGEQWERVLYWWDSAVRHCSPGSASWQGSMVFYAVHCVLYTVHCSFVHVIAMSCEGCEGVSGMSTTTTITTSTTVTTTTTTYYLLLTTTYLERVRRTSGTVCSFTPLMNSMKAASSAFTGASAALHSNRGHQREECESDLSGRASKGEYGQVLYFFGVIHYIQLVHCTCFGWHFSSRILRATAAMAAVITVQ